MLYNCAHFVELRSLQFALRNLARIKIRVGLGYGQVALRLESGLDREFANYAYAISKLRNAT